MIKIREIEQAISHLPPKKFSDFRRWFNKLDATRWDSQLEKDVKTGKLDGLAAKALRDLKEDKCKEL